MVSLTTSSATPATGPTAVSPSTLLVFATVSEMVARMVRVALSRTGVELTTEVTVLMTGLVAERTW